MENFKELLSAFDVKVKSPILGNIFLVAILINWQPIYYVIFSGSPVLEKFAFFNEHTNSIYLILLPVIFGAILTLGSALMSLAGHYLVVWPVMKLKRLQAGNASELLTFKQELTHTRRKIDAENEKAFFERAKIDQQIENEITDEAIKEKLQFEIEKLRENGAFNIQSPSNEVNEVKNVVPTNYVPSKTDLKMVQVLENRVRDLERSIKYDNLSPQNKSLAEERVLRTLRDIGLVSLGHKASFDNSSKPNTF